MNLVFIITTVCHRRCPECCYRIGELPDAERFHQPWSYFEQAAPFFQGMGELIVTGGEPLLHPEFDRISSEFRGLFRPKTLVITTATPPSIVDHIDALRNYDEVRATTYPGVEGSLRRLVEAGIKVLPLSGARLSMEVAGGGIGATEWSGRRTGRARSFPVVVVPVSTGPSPFR